MEIPFTGGCACAAIRYECLALPLRMVNCHCRDCQIASGSAYSPTLIMARSAVKLTKGAKLRTSRGLLKAATSRHASFVPPAAHPCLLQALPPGNTLESGPPVWMIRVGFGRKQTSGWLVLSRGITSIQRYLNSRRTEVARSCIWGGTECPRTTWSFLA